MEKGTASSGRSVPRRYFSDAKPAFLQLIDPRGLRVLDLGCGGGHNGELLKKAGAREVVGVELDPGPPQEARKRLDRGRRGDLAQLDPADLGDELFDAILASDVLEHLLDAEGVLARARHAAAPGRRRRHLAAQRVQRVTFSQLCSRRWPRRARVIFDRTHVRWFAKRDMIRLLEGAGLRVLRVEPYFTRYRASGRRRWSCRCTSSATTGRGSSCCSPSSQTDLTAGGTVTELLTARTSS